MILLEDLTKKFGPPSHPIVAVDNVNLELPTGEICVLLGPSGCGKTTTMKMINRLIQPTSGKVYIDGKDTSAIDPIELRRSIGYVIQQIGLFPNKTIEENICVVPDLLGWDRSKSRARAKELLELVGLQPDLFLKRYPKEISGGQQQRVGVLRALAANPPVMLMDEPVGAIDPINREVIQEEFLKMQKAIRKTIIFVSHDLDEAVKMADKIAIFRSGKLEQFASPDDLLARPANAFIEDFLGTDRALKRLRLVTVAHHAGKRRCRTLSTPQRIAGTGCASGQRRRRRRRHCRCGSDPNIGRHRRRTCPPRPGERARQCGPPPGSVADAGA